jgi:WD40 repeat protein
VLWWIENRSTDRILIVLSGGELVWDRTRGDFDWSVTTALSKDLSNRFREEPLYVDLRWAGGQDGLTLRNLQFRNAVLDLSATIRGIPKDRLDGDDVRQLRKNRRLVRAGVAAIAIAAAVAIWQAVVATQQRDEAVRQRDLAQGRQLLAEAQRLEAVDSQWTTAVLLAIEASRRSDDANSYELLWKLIAAGAKPVGRLAAKQVTGAGVAFSPDGQLAATGDADAVIIFETRGGKEVKRIPFPGWPRFIGFNAAADQIVAADDDSVRVFDLATRNEIVRRDDGTPRSVFGFSQDGQFLAVASGTRVKVKEVFAERLIVAADLPAPIAKIVVSPDGKRLALISEKKAWLLDTDNGQSIALPERRNAISSMAFSADGTVVAVASYGEKEDVVIADTALGQERARLAPGSSVASFSRRGNLLVTQPAYAALSVRDIENGRDLTRISLRDSAGLLAWSRDGELLVAGTGERDGSTSVFRVGSWRRLARLNQAVGVEAIAISPNGDLIASRAGRMTTVFESEQGAPLVHLRETGRPSRVAVSADGKIIAGVLDQKTVLAFAAGSDRPIARLNDCVNGRGLSLSADGARLAVGCYDGQARIIDIRADKVVGKVPHRYDTRLAIGPDGKLVFSVGPKGATIFDADGQDRVVRVIGGDSIAAVAFDPSAKHLAVASGSTGAKVFETSGDKSPKQFDGDKLIESVAFSPDGRRVALGARNRFVNVYDIATGQLVTALDHKEEEKEVLRVSSMVFSGDGQMLASAALDPTRTAEGSGATLRVFGLTGKELIRIPLAEMPLYIGFSPDRAFLEVAVGDKDIRLLRFPIHAQGLIEDACARMGRNLTEGEWARYLGDTPRRKTCIELNPAAAEIH